MFMLPFLIVYLGIKDGLSLKSTLFYFRTILDKDVYKRQALNREKRMQEAMLSIKKKFGKNAVLKGMNLQEGATARDRNEQIGGHKA